MAAPPESLQIRARVTANADFYRLLGRRIAAFRRAGELSQERLGERAHVSASYVAHIEIGSRKPTLDVLLRIADALGIPLWKLLTDDRMTTDEKAWDAASRELADKVRGLPQQDLRALSYLASRLGPASEAACPALRAAERKAPGWTATPTRKRTPHRS